MLTRAFLTVINISLNMYKGGDKKPSIIDSKGPDFYGLFGGLIGIANTIKMKPSVQV